MAGSDPTTDGSGATLYDRGVYYFLGGAIAVGGSLGALVDHAFRQPVFVPPIVPLWLSIGAGGLSLLWAARATSWHDRLECMCLAGLWLGDAAAPHVGGARAAVAQAICLGALGALLVQPQLHNMPTGLSRAGAALCVSASSHGFFSGVWRVASLALVAIVLLVALWIIDDLEAEGVIVAGEAPDETRGRTTRS
jgi:hypothetical protein